MFPLLWLVLGLGFRGETEGPQSPVLYVMAAEGWSPLRAGPFDQELIPMNSRAAVVPCAARTPSGIGIRLCAGLSSALALDRVQLLLIDHSADSRILVEGETGRILRAGPTRIPRVLAAEPDLQPWTLRQDGFTLPDWDARLDAALGDSPRPELRQLLWHGKLLHPAGPGRSTGPGLYDRWHGFHTVWPGERFANGSTIDELIEADFQLLDVPEDRALPLLAARIGRAEFRGWMPSRTGGMEWPEERWSEAGGDAREDLHSEDGRRTTVPPRSYLELWFEAPAVAEAGRTWTLLLKLRGDLGPRTLPADVPRFAARAPAGLLVDASRELGIDVVHFEGPDLQLDIRPTMGPGAAWGDVDGDGWVDLFLPQGGGREGGARPTSRFFRNIGGTRFQDESAARGLALAGAGMGALFYDADGDGDLDLFVANYGRNRFLLNDGTGHFTDASAAVGLDTDMWHAAVSADDFDQDGDLDLYVTSYLRYDLEAMATGDELGRYQREDPVEMLPFAFPGERKLLLRCDPATTTEAAVGATVVPIRYVDAARDLILDDVNGRGMQAVWWDFDQDGDRDLYLANDVSPNRFWRNEGDGKFRDVVFSTGLDDPRGCMGLAVGDIDGDLDEDLFVTNWQLESNALYVNNLKHSSARSRVSTFRDRAVEAGLGQLGVGTTGWGCELADFDLDGDLDLFYVNGYTSPDYETTGICVGQPCHYFENDGTGKFTAAFEKAGPDVAVPLASRAAVACDFDQDGDLDLIVTANNGRVRLLRNDAPRGKRHWLGVRLKGAGGNTYAIGARVVVAAGGRQFLRSLRAGTSYLGGNAPELHFGLGEATQVESCTVTWPSGRTSTHAIEGVDRFVTLAEPR